MTVLAHDIGKIAALVVLCSQIPVAEAAERLVCTAADTVEPIHTLRMKVRGERLYASWAKEQCLWFYPEQCDRAMVDIEIRELHSAECGGDPNTGPVVDRFRVYRKSKRVEWYNVVNDEYLEFSKVHSVGKR